MIAIIIIISPHYSYTHQKKKVWSDPQPLLEEIVSQVCSPWGRGSLYFPVFLSACSYFSLLTDKYLPQKYIHPVLVWKLLFISETANVI